MCCLCFLFLIFAFYTKSYINVGLIIYSIISFDKIKFFTVINISSGLNLESGSGSGNGSGSNLGPRYGLGICGPSGTSGTGTGAGVDQTGTP